MASAFLASQLVAPTYEAKATVVVGQSLTSANPDFQQLQVAQRLTDTYAQVATTRPVLEQVIATVGLSGWSPDALRGVLDVQSLGDLNLLVITASSRIPEESASIANGLADALVAASPAIQGQQRDVQDFLQRELESTQQEIDGMETEVDDLVALSVRTADQDSRLETLRARLVTARGTYTSTLAQLSAMSSNKLSVIEPAVVPRAPASPNVPMNTALGGMIGLLLGLAIAFVLEYVDDTIANGEEAEEATGLSSLGQVARFAGGGRAAMYSLVALLFPRSPAAEAFRTLRTNLEFASIDTDIDSILVTSAMAGEGKTTVAANLAVVMAQNSRKTLLIDADLRQPSIHDTFRISNVVGLTSTLRSSAWSAPLHTTEVENLSVLTSGPLPPNPAELLGSERMKLLIESMRRNFDLIIIDSPPVTAVTDAAVLSRLAAGTLLVVRARSTRRAAIRLGRDALTKVGAKVLGVVVNAVGPESVGAYYGSYEQDAEATAESGPWSTVAVKTGIGNSGRRR